MEETEIDLGYGDHQITLRVETSTTEPIHYTIVQCNKCGAKSGTTFNGFSTVGMPSSYTFGRIKHSTIEHFQKKFPSSCDATKIALVHDS